MKVKVKEKKIHARTKSKSILKIMPKKCNHLKTSIIYRTEGDSRKSISEVQELLS